MVTARRLCSSAALLLALCPFGANADTLGIHLASRHSAPDFCNLNLGAYYRWDAGWMVGGYRNSQCSASFYGGYLLEGSGRLRPGVVFAVISGYKGTPLLPAVLPSLALSITDKDTVRLNFMPDAGGKRSASALHLTLERTF